MNGTSNCQKCGCDFSKHKHIYYETTLFETKQVDENVVKEITTKESAARKVQAMLNRLEDVKREHEQEHEFILNSLATFASFLKKNAITAYNDAYGKYIGYLIDR